PALRRRDVRHELRRAVARGEPRRLLRRAGALRRRGAQQPLRARRRGPGEEAGAAGRRLPSRHRTRPLPRAQPAPARPLPRLRPGIYLGSGEGAIDFEPFIAANLSAWNDEARASDPARWAATAYERMSAVREIEQEPNMPMSHIAAAFGASGPAYNCLT